MNVELPTKTIDNRDIVCVFANGNNQFIALTYNPSMTNASSYYLQYTYYLIDGKLIPQSVKSTVVGNLNLVDPNTAQLASTRYCLQDGDLVYKPELKINFQFYSMILLFILGIILYKMIIRRLLP